MVFGLEITVLDRIPCYERTMLKEEFLYFSVSTAPCALFQNNHLFSLKK
jgi:hypothetical protein